uniref:Uncharacterized protein n=1 Tax=Electrophorus electricus TaxID=8005 RepID=A0A4W4FRY2_ELEEL
MWYSNEVVFWCGLLMLSLTLASTGQKGECDIRLKIPRGFHTSESETLEGNGNINNRSLSPWNWIPNSSFHRIPEVIFEAECKTDYCNYPISNQKTELNSVPIYQDILVLKQDQANRNCFTASFQRVIISCTCVWAQTEKTH